MNAEPSHWRIPLDDPVDAVAIASVAFLRLPDVDAVVILEDGAQREGFVLPLADLGPSPDQGIDVLATAAIGFGQWLPGCRVAVVTRVSPGTAFAATPERWERLCAQFEASAADVTLLDWIELDSASDVLCVSSRYGDTRPWGPGDDRPTPTDMVIPDSFGPREPPGL